MSALRAAARAPPPPPQAAGFVRAVFALNEEGELEALLKDAGFRRVTVDAVTRELSLPAPKDFLWQYVGSRPSVVAMECAIGSESWWQPRAARRAMDSQARSRTTLYLAALVLVAA